MKVYTAPKDATLYDICLATYGSLNFLSKLIIDNRIDGLNTYPEAGQQFVYDETLIFTALIPNIKYSTKYPNNSIQYACPIITFRNVGTTSIEIEWNGVAGRNYFYELSDKYNNLIYSGSTYDNYHLFENLLSDSLYHLRVSANLGSCNWVSKKTSKVMAGLFMEWAYFAEEPFNLDTLNYPNKKQINHEQSALIRIDNMPTDSWLVLRYPITEPDFTYYESGFESGNLFNDFTFLNTEIIGDWKYIKTRNSSTFDTTKPIIFSR